MMWQFAPDHYQLCSCCDSIASGIHQRREHPQSFPLFPNAPRSHCRTCSPCFLQLGLPAGYHQFSVEDQPVEIEETGGAASTLSPDKDSRSPRRAALGQPPDRRLFLFIGQRRPLCPLLPALKPASTFKGPLQETKRRSSWNHIAVLMIRAYGSSTSVVRFC